MSSVLRQRRRYEREVVSCTDESMEDDEPSTKTNDARSLPVTTKLKKAGLRVFIGTILMATFGYIIYLGHAPVCIMVFLLQCCLFKELVGVRKQLAKEKHLPLFRSVQWAWFFLAAFYTWSDGMFTFLRERFLELNPALRMSSFLSFMAYCFLMIVSVLTLRKGTYRYQISQYCWTVTTCCLVVFQCRAVFQMIYAGLFWFVLPCSLVICNDSCAYFCGQLFGKKFIKRPFLEISPNKTWEGFFGSAICTLFFAWHFAAFLSSFDALVCVPEDLALLSGPLACTPSKMYQVQELSVLAEYMLPSNQLPPWAEGLKVFVVSIIERFGGRQLHARASQVHALALACFASTVAPFGGFLASAIKRAYGIKDFNNMLPGHGGLMDRFDCQLIMLMCTYAHHSNFCRLSSGLSVDTLVAAVSQLKAAEREELLRRLREAGM